MKRRSFLKLTTAPAFAPLLNLYPAEVWRELATKKVARWGERYVANTWTVHGPMVVTGMDIVGPHYGKGVPSGEQQHAAAFTVYRASIEGRQTSHDGLLHFSVLSDQIYRWVAEPFGQIIVGEGESLIIRSSKGGGIIPAWNVFTVYRK